MKRIAFILSVIILASCGRNEKTAESIKAEISSYKDKITEYTSKIKELEKELATIDTTVKQKITGKSVGITEIKPQVFNHFIEIQGKLDGNSNVGVSPEAPGMVTKIFVKEGDLIQEGQMIAQLNDAAAREQLKGMETQLELLTSLYNKQKELWDQKIGSEVQFLQAKTTKEAMESNVAGVRKQIDMMKIKAPVSGTIASLPIKEGQMASPQYPACIIVNFNQLKAVAEAAESYSSRIKEGDHVSLYIPDLKKEIDAKVDFCSKYINPLSRTFSVEAFFNGTNEMKANMVIVLKVKDYSSANAIVVPINMIQDDVNNKYVYVAEMGADGQSIATRKSVKIGQTYNGLAEIVSGLAVGDKLISAGYSACEQGEVVEIQ